MKKNLIALSILFAVWVVSMIVINTKHYHDWNSATCYAPSTCVDCGETIGAPSAHNWAEATCMLAKHCTYCGVTEGEIGLHNWVEATCTQAKHCTYCGIAEGELALHNWVEATCTQAKYCYVCKKTEGEAIGHNWSVVKYNTPSKCYNCGEIRPLLLPMSGEVFIGKDLYRGSEIKITSNTTQSCYIKLKESSGTDVFSFFVRANSTVTVDVPQGNYYVYFSYGDDWYGTEYLFGDKTTYAKDDEMLDFRNYTWEYTLTPVIGGNFSETPIDAEEFK